MKVTVFPLFCSLSLLAIQIFRLQTVLSMFTYSAEPNAASKLQHQSHRETIPWVGKLNACWLQCLRPQDQMTAQIQLSDSQCFTCVFTVSALIYS